MPARIQTATRKRRKAFILAAVFFIMVVIILLVASLFRLVPQEVRWTGDHRRDTLAYYAASGGVKHALAWLRQVRLGEDNTDPFQRAFPNDPYQRVTIPNPGDWPYRLKPATDPNPDGADTYFPPGMQVLQSKDNRIRVGGDWCAEVTIFPDKNTAPHPHLSGAAGSQAPCYTLVALSFRDTNGNGRCDTGVGGESYALRVEASAVERTFANYAYFVDAWPDLADDTTAFALQNGMTEALFSGPVHTNGTPLLQIIDPGTYWGETGRPAPFGGEVSFVGDEKGADSYDGIAYLGGNFRGADVNFRPYRGSDPYTPDSQRYDRLYAEGRQGVRRTQRIELPNNWKRIAEAAWGDAAGLEVTNVDGAPLNQVFVNNVDLGIAVTGGLQEMRLDLVDEDGKSTVFQNGYVRTPQAFRGNSVITMTQSEPVQYVAGEEPIMITTTTEEIGPYSYTVTDYSETAQEGYEWVSYIATTGTTTVQIPRYEVSGSTIIDTPPGGAGPASGASVTRYTYETTMVDSLVPVTEEATRFERLRVVTGDGPHQVTNVEDSGETRPIIEEYNPIDTVVSADDEDVKFPINYFVDPSAAPPDAQFPVLIGATTGVEVTIPRGSTAIIRQDREKGGTFDVKLLPIQKETNTVAVYGAIRSLKGVNRHSRTIMAVSPDTPRLDPEQLSPINLDDHLLQHNLLPPAKPSNARNGLGLVAANVTMDGSPPILNRFRTQRAYVYANLLVAQGSFFVSRLVDGSPLGQLTLIGGVVQKQIGSLVRGPSGWSSRYIYDPNLPLQPPPAYPPDGRFDITFMRVTVP